MSSADLPIQPQLHQLYVNHHQWLNGWLRKRLGDAFDAADIAHDTYVRLLVTQSAPDESRARPFLAQIARGLSIDLYRRRQIEAAYVDTLREMPAAELPSEETRAIIIEALMMLDRALSSLPPKVRQAFLLRQIEDMPYSEIGARLGVSVSSIEKYIVKALTVCYATRFESS